MNKTTLVSDTPNKTVNEADESAEIETELDAPIYK